MRSRKGAEMRKRLIYGGGLATVAIFGAVFSCSKMGRDDGHYHRVVQPAVGDRLRVISIPESVDCSTDLYEHVAITMAAVPRAELGVSGDGVLLGTSCRTQDTGHRIHFLDPGSSDLNERDVEGQVVHTLDTKLNGTNWAPPLGWGAFSYRGDGGFVAFGSVVEPVLLGCSNPASDQDPHEIYSIDLQSGEVTKLFDAALPTEGKPYCDGMAYDPWNDTLFMSSDISDTIYQYTLGGTLIKTLPVPEPGCYVENEDNEIVHGNSGLEVVGNNLLVACNGRETVYEIRQTDGSIVNEFPSGAERAEDIACDRYTFATGGADEVAVAWTKDAFTPQFIGFETPPGSCGICRTEPRTNIQDLSASDRQDLATYLEEYLTADIIGGHNDNFSIWHRGSAFIAAHRGYIGGFEIWMLNVKQDDRFVPMPYWNPAEPIPSEFMSVVTDACVAAGGSAFQCADIAPNSSLPWELSDSQSGQSVLTDADGNLNLCDRYDTYEELAVPLEGQYHDPVHGAVGGVMGNGYSPSATVFWIWHSFIDELSGIFERECQQSFVACTDVHYPDTPSGATGSSAGTGALASAPIGFWWWFEDMVIAPDMTPAEIVDHSGLALRARVRGGAEISTGTVGQALLLDGVDDFAEALDENSGEVGSGSFTLDAWVKTSVAGRQPISEKLGDGERGYSFYLQDGQVSLYLKTDSDTVDLSATGPSVADGDWHHVAVVMDRGIRQARFLVDGALAGEFDTPDLAGSASASGSLLLGKSELGSNDSFFEGKLDEVYLSRRALTNNLVASTFRAGSAGKYGAMGIAPTWTDRKDCIEDLGDVVDMADIGPLTALYDEAVTLEQAGDNAASQNKLTQLAEAAMMRMMQEGGMTSLAMTLMAVEGRARVCGAQLSPSWMSFEDPARTWSVGVGQQTLLVSDADSTHLNSSLEVNKCGYGMINSPVFSTDELAVRGPHIRFDVKIPEEQDNPYWTGDIQVHVSVPSGGVYNAWVGQVLMNNLEKGVWHEFEYEIPAWVLPAFQASHDDAKVHLALTTGNCTNAPVVTVDHLRFEE